MGTAIITIGRASSTVRSVTTAQELLSRISETRWSVRAFGRTSLRLGCDISVVPAAFVTRKSSQKGLVRNTCSRFSRMIGVRVSLSPANAAMASSPLFWSIEPTFESYCCEIDLLLYGVVQLRATQSPHVSEVKHANQNQRHRYTSSEEQQFSANSQLYPLDRDFETG